MGDKGNNESADQVMDQVMPRLQIDGFRGVVHLHNWIRSFDGQQYDSIAGTVRILSDEQATGFKATGHNTANWIARVEGPKCSVRAVFESQTMSLEEMSQGTACLQVP